MRRQLARESFGPGYGVGGVPARLELVEHEEGSGDEAGEGGEVIPVEAVAEVEEAEDAEDGEGTGADAVCGDLQAVLEEGDGPADQDDLPKGDLFELEVAVPGKGHEDVGADKQKDGPHRE